MQVTQERDGWSRVPHWLLTSVKPASVVVYAALAAYAWMPDGARPAIKRVAGDLDMSESTVKRCIQELSEAGALVVESRVEEGVQLPNRYHLRLNRGGGGFTSDPRGGFITEPRVGSPVTYEEEEAREEGSKKKNSASHDEVTADFDAFWELYPRRVGKGQAVKAYRTARKITDADTILKAVKRYPFNREQPQFIPYPATWLNGERWADELPGTTPATRDDAVRRQGGVSW